MYVSHMLFLFLKAVLPYKEGVCVCVECSAVVYGFE